MGVRFPQGGCKHPKKPLIGLFIYPASNLPLILFENLFKPRQRRLTVYMLLTSSVLSATSKQCFELTSSVLSTTSKQCFEQPVASFLVCSLIFIEYKTESYFIECPNLLQSRFKVTQGAFFDIIKRTVIS